MNIKRDQSRFREIVRGKIRENLRKFITHGEMIGRKGHDLVSIPLPQLELPHFRFGQNGSGGVGQGDGEPGKALGPGQPGAQPGPAGDAPGQHILEVEVSLAQLAEILGEEMALPRIEPKGRAQITEQKARYDSIRRSGPESLRHFKRTYLQALRRHISARTYTPDRPRIIPIKDDKRFRSWTTVPKPQSCAVIIYMMDVSGSMTNEQKEIVRTEAFWIDSWLRHEYEGLEVRYIIHDAAARVVDEQTFYHTRESGGTRISSAYEECRKLIEAEFPPSEWNIYCFHFSDGDNWGEDNEICLKLLAEQLLPKINLFGYGQVESPYGSGEFLRALEAAYASGLPENLLVSEIPDRDSIFDSIKHFLGAGK